MAQNPGDVTEVFSKKIAAQVGKRTPDFDKKSLEIALETIAAERARVVGLFRKGRIDETALDSQLDEIETEERSLRDRLNAAKRFEPAKQLAALATVEALLKALRSKLDQGVTWELKRQLVEVPVDSITIDTVESAGKRKAVINVRYKFVSSPDTCTDRRACNKRDWSMKPECRSEPQFWGESKSSNNMGNAVSPDLTLDCTFTVEETEIRPSAESMCPQDPLSRASPQSICWSGSGRGATCFFNSEGFVGHRPRFELFAGWLTLFATEGWTGPMYVRPVIILPGFDQPQQRPAGEPKKLESFSFYVGEALQSAMRMGDTLRCSRSTNLNVHYSLVRDSETIPTAGAVGSVDPGGSMAVWESLEGYRPEATTEIPNLVLASDYVKTYTDLACMEGANEAARRAVNGILDHSGAPAARAPVWPLQEPDYFRQKRLISHYIFLGKHTSM